jgi:hypothetical protein
MGMGGRGPVGGGPADDIDAALLGVMGEAGTGSEAETRRRSCCWICNSLICNANFLAWRTDWDADNLREAFCPCPDPTCQVEKGTATERGPLDEDGGAGAFEDELRRESIGSTCPLAGVTGVAGALGVEETLGLL